MHGLYFKDFLRNSVFGNGMNNSASPRVQQLVFITMLLHRYCRACLFTHLRIHSQSVLAPTEVDSTHLALVFVRQMLLYKYAVIHDYLNTCYVSNVVFNAVTPGKISCI